MLRTRVLLSAWAVCFAFPAAPRAQQPNVDPIPVGNVAERLGVKLMPSAPTELDFGTASRRCSLIPARLKL